MRREIIFILQALVMFITPFMYFKIIYTITPSMGRMILFTLLTIIAYVMLLFRVYENWKGGSKDVNDIELLAKANFGLSIIFLIILSAGLVVFSPYLNGLKVYWTQDKVMSFYMKTTNKNVYINPEFNEYDVYGELSRIPPQLMDGVTLIFKTINETEYVENGRIVKLYGLHDPVGDYIKIVRTDFDASHIVHEIGHTRWAKIDNRDRQWWIEHWNETSSITDYGNLNFMEDFAESFRCYVFPEHNDCYNDLKGEKFEIIKRVVEDGKP
jgi:hypothetical protein